LKIPKKNKFFIQLLTDSKIILQSQKGIAILMVLSAVMIMIFVLADFRFETEINKRKVYNQQDKAQARLNAEAGIRLALARLDLYQEARNLIEKNPQRKKSLPNTLLNKIYNVPFIYPIPLLASFDVKQKSLVEEFLKKTLLTGGLEVFIQEASSLINLNLLRLQTIKDFDPNKKFIKKTKSEEDAEKEDEEKTDDESDTDSDDTGNPLTKVAEKLTEMLNNALELKKDNDELFALEYANVEADRLIKILKFYVNSREEVAKDPELNEIEQIFSEANITPKHGPLSSLSELYLLPEWDDKIIDLIRDQVTVHGSMAIDLNKMNASILKLIAPDLTDEQITQFFDYRDNPEDPHHFDSIDDVKKYVVAENFITEEDFDTRVKELKKAGLSFGGNSNLFKISSLGRVGNAEYQISAWALMPVKPPPAPETKKPNSSGSDDPDGLPNDPNDPNDIPSTNPSSPAKKKPPPKKRALQFLSPRLIEITGD
jgi:hypothetical protein